MFFLLYLIYIAGGLLPNYFLIKKGGLESSPPIPCSFHRNGSDLNCKRMSDVAVALGFGSHPVSKLGLYIKELIMYYSPNVTDCLTTLHLRTTTSAAK